VTAPAARTLTPDELALGPRLSAEVLSPMKRAFVGKDVIVDLLGVALAAGENLFLLGPPGTAKSALVRDLGRRLGGASFEYLLTRFTEPSELFGPFDIRRLREGDLVTNTDGMLPEASFVFLDELLNANSAILNGLLTVLNERVFRRGRETRPLPALVFVAASNRLPDDEALAALFDRFLLRVRCDNVAEERLTDVLAAGRALERDASVREAASLGSGALVGSSDDAAPASLDRAPTFGVDEARRLQRLIPRVDVGPARKAFVELVGRLRAAGLPISDRRAVKLERAVAASALLCGRDRAIVSDLWVVRHAWDTEESREVTAAQVAASLARAEGEAGAHPLAREEASPDPEALLAEALSIEARLLADPPPARGERSALRDRAGLLSARAAWVPDGPAKEALLARLDRLLAEGEPRA